MKKNVKTNNVKKVQQQPVAKPAVEPVVEPVTTRRSKADVAAAEEELKRLSKYAGEEQARTISQIDSNSDEVYVPSNLPAGEATEPISKRFVSVKTVATLEQQDIANMATNKAAPKANIKRKTK